MSIDGPVLSHQALVRHNILVLVLIGPVLDGCPSKVESAVNPHHLCFRSCSSQLRFETTLLKHGKKNFRTPHLQRIALIIKVMFYRVRTEAYPGYLPGYYPYPTLVWVLLDIHTRTPKLL